MAKIKNKKYILIFILACIILIFILIILINKNKNKEFSGISLYFYNPVLKKLETEKTTINETDNQKILEIVIKKFLNGPKSTISSSIFPREITASNMNLDVDTLEIEFSEEYDLLKNISKLTFRSAFIWSLTELNFVNNIKILNDNAEKNLTFNRLNVIINHDIEPLKTTKQWITLYFPDNSYTGLYAEDRIVTMESEDRKLSKYIMQYLLQGPINSNKLSKVILEEVKLIKVDTYEGICYLDFNQEFLSKISSDPNIELLQIYSIVNSLTIMKQIDKVQFLVEGKKPQGYAGKLDLDKPQEMRKDLIKS